jgi:hypothetical protein
MILDTLADFLYEVARLRECQRRYFASGKDGKWLDVVKSCEKRIDASIIAMLGPVSADELLMGYAPITTTKNNYVSDSVLSTLDSMYQEPLPNKWVGKWVNPINHPTVQRFVTRQVDRLTFEDDGLVSKQAPSDSCVYSNYELSLDQHVKSNAVMERIPGGGIDDIFPEGKKDAEFDLP